MAPRTIGISAAGPFCLAFYLSRPRVAWPFPESEIRSALGRSAASGPPEGPVDVGRARQGDSGGYRYRGSQEPDTAAVQAEKIRKLLRAERQRISFNASSVRDLSVRLNQQIAQALCDGMKVPLLAGAAELSRWTVRTIGLSSEDLFPSGVPAEQHLAVIGGLKSELAELAESKATLEGRRVNLLAAARRLGVLDDYELAALSGLQRETIRKMTWGLQPTAVG